MPIMQRRQNNNSSVKAMNFLPIYSAINSYDLEKLEVLLKEEKKSSSHNIKSSFTPLHFAAKIGYDKAAEMLIQYGADLNARYIKQSCTERNRSHTEQNDFSDLNQLTPLNIAIMHENKEVILVLLSAGACMHSISQERRRKMLLESVWNEDLFNALLPHVEGLSEFNQSSASIGNTSLKNEIQRRHNRLKYLLEQGIGPNIPGYHGCTPLHWAASLVDIVALKILLEYGADLEAVNKKGSTVLQLVVQNVFIKQQQSSLDEIRRIEELIEIIKILLNSGANPNACNNDGWMVFELAAGGILVNELSYYENYYMFKLLEDVIEWLLIYGSDWRSTKIDFFKKKRVRADEIIVEYNLKRKLAGLKFQDDALIEKKSLSMEGFKKRCVEELEKMKTWYLFENMTMYRFLCCSSRRSLVSLLSREEVKEIHKQALYKAEFPIYKNLLEHKFMQGEKYEAIYDSAYDNLNNLCEYRLTNIVIDKIIDYIGEKDIKNLIEA